MADPQFPNISLISRDEDKAGVEVQIVCTLAREGDQILLTNPDGGTRSSIPPWKVNHSFVISLHTFNLLTRNPVRTDVGRAALIDCAKTLGHSLSTLLFDDQAEERLKKVILQSRSRLLLTIRSDDDLMLSLPWELLWLDGFFLLQHERVELVRSTLEEVGPEALVREPDSYLKLVVNVSAPEGSELNYEEESYRITQVLSGQCRFVPTELGTVEDLVKAVREERPTAIHFSGHGAPGTLIFE